jgi:hypothetical protein
VEIELVPHPGPDDPTAIAALAALAREGLVSGPRPAGPTSAWRRAGLNEAISHEVGSEVDPPAGAPPVGPARHFAGRLSS